MFGKVKKNLKFILKIQFEDEEPAILNKVAPILNQLGMDETALLDDFLYSFFMEKAEMSFGEDETITSTVHYMIWKNPNLFHQIRIKPFIFYEYCYKYNKELISFLHSFDKLFKDAVVHYKKKLFSAFSLFFFLPEGMAWNLDTGYSFSSAKFYNSFFSFVGIRKSYSERDKMLGRKINFRRKIRKKKFEEY